MKALLRGLALFFGTLFIATLFSAQVLASGFEVSPIKFELSQKPGESITKTLKIKNSEDKAVDIAFDFADFTYRDESGQVAIIDGGAQDTTYSMKNWVQTPEGFNLGAKEEKEFTISMRIPEDAPPGGHYGTMFIYPKIPNSKDGKPSVGTITKIGVLFIVRVEGEVKEEVGIASFVAYKDTASPNTLYLETFLTNSGNVHVRPKGKIFLYNDSGELIKDVGIEKEINQQGVTIGSKKVDYLAFNEDNYLALPGQKRLFETNYEGNAGEIFAKAEVKISYGNTGKSLESGKVDFKSKKLFDVREGNKSKTVTSTNIGFFEKNMVAIIIGVVVLIGLLAMFGGKKKK